MKKWIKKAGILTAGASLLATTVFTTPLAFAETRLNAFSQQNGQLEPWNSPINQNERQQSALSEDELVINYTKPLSSAQYRMAGGTLIKQFSDLHFAVVKIGIKQKLSYAIDNYRKFTNVLSVTPSAYYQPLALEDPKASEQYQNDLLHLSAAQALTGKYPVTVAVIDQGIDMNHPDLKGRLLPGYNSVTPMNQGSPDFHGTHVAGILAADKGNGIGGYGVNPKAKILPIDVFDRNSQGASDYSIAQGILYAVQKGAKIINMSLGSSMPSPLIEEAIKKALDKNVTVVAAAGNTGDDTPSYPAAYEGVISVGSVNQEKKLSDFSTFGPSIDVVAPGEGIYSTIYEYERKSSFRRMSGTSMATPMVAGTASLLLSKYPNLTPYQIEYILEHTAEDLGDKGFDVKYGNGLINPLNAMKFDVKKIPSIVKPAWTEEEQLASAEKVVLEENNSFSGSITKPFAEKWYETEVKKGDNIQFVLDGASKFDYKLMLQLLSPDQKVHMDVNKVREGKKEGKLFEAPFSGTLLFGVKDVNDHYDDSSKSLSKFTLTTQKMNTAPEDESTIINPVQLEFPYQNTEQHFTLTGAGGDDDYYRFSVKEKQAVKINLSAIPGVDTSLGVYTADQFFPKDIDKMSSEDKQAVMDRLVAGTDEIDPVFYANKGGYSEGESLTFSAEPDVSYIVKVSNKVENNSGVIDYYQNSGQMMNDQQPEPSILPYQLEITGKVFPADEDTLPMNSPDDGSKAAPAPQNTMDPQDPSLKIVDQNDYIQSIKDGARSYDIGATADDFLHSTDDEDWFAVTPKSSGVYSFNLSETGNSVPDTEVYRIAEDKDSQ
ncbi:MAG: S8 family peptidase, partial [Bacillota bacterium]|nr:S8 family peptidase [Bacillota bacterium]